VEVDRQAARKAAEITRYGERKYPVMRTTQVPSDEHTLSPWHPFSGKQNTYSAIVSISDVCYRNRTDTSANDMLTDVLYFAIEDLPPAEPPVPHAFLTRTSFITALDENSRLGDMNFSGRCEDPTCAAAISTPLRSIQGLLRHGNNFFTCSQECSDAKFATVAKSNPRWRMASPEFLHTIIPVSFLGATEDYQIVRRMQRSDETAKLARFVLREDETIFRGDADLKHLLNRECDDTIQITSPLPSTTRRDKFDSLDVIVAVARGSVRDDQSEAGAGFGRCYRRTADLLEAHLLDRDTRLDVRYFTIEDGSSNSINNLRVNDGPAVNSRV